MSQASMMPEIAYTGPEAHWPEKVYYGLTGRAWLRVGIIATLMLALFWPNLRRLWFKTNPYNGEANWGHAFFVPVIGLYYLYLNREILLRTRVQTAWAGMAILLLGLATFAYGIWPGQNDFIKDFAMVVTLFGVTTLLCGWQVMKIAWFPIVFLVCSIPWPGLVYSWLALPLQEMAASAAVATLRTTGVDALNTGTQIVIGEGEKLRVLNVAEACAGLKSLMTFVTVGAAVAFLSSRQLWQKVVISLSAIPIAIFCNMMRVAGQGILDHYVSQKLSESFAHQFVGLIMLIPAFFLILLVAWIIDNIFIEEVDKRSLGRKRSEAGRGLVIEVPRGAAASPPVAHPLSSAAPAPAAASAESADDALAAATRRLMAASSTKRTPRPPRDSAPGMAKG